MSRIGAQRVVNNFSGGLVTEANQLTFPENSLSEAYNVELGVDGSIQTRGAFDSLRGSRTMSVPGFTDFRDISAVKKFYWKEKRSTLVVYIISTTGGGVVFSLVKDDGTIISADRGVNPGSTFSISDAEKYFDVGFSSDEFLFTLKFKEGLYSRNIVYSGKLSEDGGTLRISEGYSTATSTSSLREPAVGFYDDYPQYGYVISIDPWSMWASIYWNGTKVYQGAPGSAIVVGDHTYYVDGPQHGPYVVGGTDEYRWGIYRVSSINEGAASESHPLRYRDFKGVPNYLTSSDIANSTSRSPSIRFSMLSAFSAYNLYNAGWPNESTGLRYVTDQDHTGVSSPGANLVAATRAEAGAYPSLCDAYYEHIAEQGSAKTIGVYSPHLLRKTPPFSLTPRKGTHILSMGYEFFPGSENEQNGAYFYPRGFSSTTPPLLADFYTYASQQASVDSTITSVAIIGGRAWYGVKGRGFNVAYSQVNYVSDSFISDSMGNYVNCFQVNNPNSEVMNDVLDTDGGTLTISEVGDIYKIVEYKNHILIFAENGVWSISGGASTSFLPTSYTIQKVSEDGVSRGESVISTDDGVFYVSREDLKAILLNQSGILTVSDVSETKIKSKMFEVAREFNSSVNACLVLDRENKRIHINYTKPVDGFSTASNSLKLSGQSHSLVFDIRLGSFYEWGLAYDNKTADGESLLPGILYDQSYIDNYKIDLGLMYDDKEGMCALFQNGVVTGESLLTLRMGRTLYKYKQGYGALSTTDGGSLTRGVPRFPVTFEIPFDLVGDMTLSKSVQTMHIFQDASPDYFELQENGDGSLNLLRPEIYMSACWDWNTYYTKDQEILGNIQYPEVHNYLRKKVLINKVKVPGSGRCLSLRFKNRTDGQLFGGAFKLLAYYLDINADARP